MTRLRRHRPRRRLARRALRRRAGRGRPARRGRRARAGRRRVLVLGVHPVEDAAASRARPCTPRTRRRRPREVDVDGGARLARLHGLELLRRRPGALAGRQRHRPAARQRPARRDRAWSRSTASRHTAEHVVVATGADPFVPPVPGLRELDGRLDEPRGDRHEGRPAPAARARRRSGRRRDGAGRAPPRRRGGARRGRRARARRASPRRSARRSARCCAATASSSSLGVHATRGAPRRRRLRPRARRRPRAARRPPAGRHRPAPARRGHRPGDGRHRRPTRTAIPVDAQLRAGERLWAIGDVTGIWPLTHVGKYQGEVVAANILGEPREANYEAVPRVVFTDPQAAAVGATEAPFSATAPLSGIAKTATYTRAYAESNGFLTLLSDGERLTGAYALGPEAGEWLQQATLAIRAARAARRAARHHPAVPDVLRDLRRRAEGAARRDRRRAAIRRGRHRMMRRSA